MVSGLGLRQPAGASLVAFAAPGVGRVQEQERIVVQMLDSEPDDVA